MGHAVLVATEADDDEALLFGEDGLINVPAGVEVRKHNRTHFGDVCCGVVGCKCRSGEAERKGQ